MNSGSFKNIICLGILISIFSCSKTGVQCDNINIQKIIIASEPCKGTGRIEIVYPNQNGLTFSLNNFIIQDDPIFSNLKPGSYKVNILKNDVCIFEDVISVDTVQSGKLFLDVKRILQRRCVSCHSGVNPQAGVDFNNSCDIVSQWERIEARAIIGFPSPMPQDGLIPISERIILLEWIKKGHRFVD
jgi:hypothetical protein